MKPHKIHIEAKIVGVAASLLLSACSTVPRGELSYRDLTGQNRTGEQAHNHNQCAYEFAQMQARWQFPLRGMYYTCMAARGWERIPPP